MCICLSCHTCGHSHRLTQTGIHVLKISTNFLYFVLVIPELNLFYSRAVFLQMFTSGHLSLLISSRLLHTYYILFSLFSYVTDAAAPKTGGDTGKVVAAAGTNQNHH